MTPWFLYFLLATVLALENWPTLSSILTVVQRSHRDVGKDAPLDQIATFGVSLGSQLFAKEGYVPSALTDFRNLLNVGTQTVMVDLYWNGATQKWQMCPAPYPANVTGDGTMELEWKGNTYNCDASFTMDSLVRAMLPFFQDTNNIMKVNVVNVLVNLKEIDFSSPNGTTSYSDVLKYIPKVGSIASYGNETLAASFDSFGSTVFTPAEQDEFNGERDSTFYNTSGTSTPSVYNLAWLQLKRVAVRVAGNEIKDTQFSYNVTDEDKAAIFFPESSNAIIVRSIDNSTVDAECTNLEKNLGNLSTSLLVDMAINQHFKFVVDNDQNNFDNTTYTSFTNCGYSPILNASDYYVTTLEVNNTSGNNTISNNIGDIINNFLSLAFLRTELTQDTDEESMKAATRCVVLLSALMIKVVNCYNKYPYACQNDLNPVEWHVGEDERAYFDAYGETCPDGYQFSVPHLLVELIALQNEIHKRNISYPVWIDINDITVNLCFVSGGPYADCPYQATVSRLKLVRLIAPSFVVGAVILVLMFMEKFFRTNPIQTRRKLYWRRRIAEFNKLHEYEGVPS